MSSDVGQILEPTYRTKEVCACCSDQILYGQGIVLIQIVRLKVVTNGAQRWMSFLEESTDEKELIYAPYFVEAECWDVAKEELCVRLEELAPLNMANSVATCSICGSGVVDGELIGTAHSGVLCVSLRHPNGRRADDFQMATRAPDLVCACCLVEFNSDTPIWDDDDFKEDASQRERWSLT